MLNIITLIVALIFLFRFDFFIAELIRGFNINIKQNREQEKIMLNIQEYLFDMNKKLKKLEENK